MFGGNFGLVGSFDGARRLLKRLTSVTARNARILANGRDPYQTDDPDFLDYHARKSCEGQDAGQIRMRIRLRRFATPWFNWLIVSRQEMEQILDGTDWAVDKYIGSDRYTAVIKKV